MNESHISRKQLLRMVGFMGAGSAGVYLLAGCGNTGTVSLPGRTGDGDQRPGAAPGEVIVAEEEVETNSAVPFTNAETGQPAVLVRLPQGELVAYSAVCTHQGCTVSYQAQTQQLVCPCHGGVFDPAKDAAVVAGPPPTPLPEVAFEVKDGKVLLA